MDEEMMQSNLLELEEFDEEKMKAESADLLELRYLTKENAKFERTPGGFVKLTYKDKTYDRVGVYRTFPVTMPEEFISIREADEKAREIGVIEKLSALDPEQAKMLKEQLDLRYFTPEITKIFDIKTEYGYGYFHVMTTSAVVDSKPAFTVSCHYMEIAISVLCLNIENLYNFRCKVAKV